MLLVQGLDFDEFADLVSDQVRVNTWLNTLHALLGLFAFYTQGRIKVLQADFESFLHANISDSHGVIYTFIFSLMLSGLLDLSNDLAALLGQVDADRKEISDLDLALLVQVTNRRVAARGRFRSRSSSTQGSHN